MDKPEQIAAELWPMAQLGPNEGIQDAIDRMAPTIQRAFEERQGQLILVDDAAVERGAKAACLVVGDDPEREGSWDDWCRESAYFKMVTAAVAAMGGK